MAAAGFGEGRGGGSATTSDNRRKVHNKIEERVRCFDRCPTGQVLMGQLRVGTRTGTACDGGVVKWKQRVIWERFRTRHVGKLQSPGGVKVGWGWWGAELISVR